MTDAEALRARYRDAAGRAAALVASLDDDRGAAPVAACPDWSVHDLAAHLAGAAADAVSSRMDGAPGPAWSARHVGERADVSMAELADEIVTASRKLPEPLFAQPGPTPVWDLLVHEADLRETAGAERQPHEAYDTLLPVVTAFLGMAGRPAGGLVVTTSDGVWTIGAGGRTALLRGDDYELYRILFSRRSQRQIEAVTDDDRAALGEIGLFGPREDDQPVPAPS